jgi:hypothetical protein
MTCELHAEHRWVHGASGPEELRRKYRDERDKRLRPHGKAQYLDVTGSFERFAADPYLEPTEPNPTVADVDVLILDGWSGLQMTVRLQGRCPGLSHHRPSGRLRRRLVLEPVSPA